MLKIFKKFTYQKICFSTGVMSDIKTFIFLDLETTGLPNFENNKTKITELCLTAIQAEHIRLGVFPRVQNKLNLCFNPNRLISAGSEDITGLSNHLLENSSRFSQETITIINNFLNHSPQPVCFVAHNGLKFDYPVLRREIDQTKSNLQDSVLCVDSLITFQQLDTKEENESIDKNVDSIQKNRENMEIEENLSGVNVEAKEIRDTATEAVDALDGVRRTIHPSEGHFDFNKPLFSHQAQTLNETTPKRKTNGSNEAVPLKPKKLKHAEARRSLNFGGGYKLVEVFSRLTKKEPLNAHQADADVQMLIECAATLGDKFVDWCNQNAKMFCDIPPMVPGKKIGT